MMKKTNYLFLIGLVLLIGCSVGTTNWNDHIDAESRTQIKTLNDKFIQALQEKNSQKIRELFAEELKAKLGSDLEAFVTQAHNFLVSDKFTIVDEYKTNRAIGTNASVFKGVSGEYDYKVSFKVRNKESYVSLLLNEGVANSMLLTFIYGKYGDEWRINDMRIGAYSYFGKNAIDFYKQAKVNYEKGNLIDAADDIMMLQQTGAPANELFQYQKDEEMKTFAGKVFGDASKKFPLPMPVLMLKTTPQIFNIAPKPMSEGIFPMVTYISKINLKDTVALEKENQELKKVIGTLFPGIEKGKKFVFFQAYNEIPNGKTPTEHYGFALVSSEQ